MRLLYSLVLTVISPLVIVKLWWRGSRAPAYRQRWGERFGFVPTIEGQPIWVHAVSVGEAQAAAPMIKQLLVRYPEVPLLVTTTTPTGSERVQALFGDKVHHVYMPYDLPSAVKRFLTRVSPRMVVVMETELWPNLFHQCHVRDIPVIVANARLSERSAKGYGRFPGLVEPTLANISVIAAQDHVDADRFQVIGARISQLNVTGSIKFDISLPASLREQGDMLRRESFGPDRSVLVAASTHEGEDELVLDAFAKIKAAVPGALLVLVPRHPERFDSVATLCADHGFHVIRRSDNAACGADTEVFVGDTMGEMMLFFAASDVAFMGGSLVPVGGHNLLEPAALELPVVFGPHMFNFQAISKMFVDVGAASQVANVDELEQVVVRWMQHAEQRGEAGGKGLALVEGNRGALQRLMALIDQHLPGN